MKNNFFIFLAKICLIFFFSSNTFANVLSPENFIQIIVDDAKKILVASNSKEYKYEKLTELAKEKVDIKGIGLYTLGSYRKELSDAQKEEDGNGRRRRRR